MMQDYRTSYVDRLTDFVRWVSENPLQTLCAAAIATYCALAYAITYFQVNSDTSDMIDPDTPFLINYRNFQDAFPSYADTIVIVIEAEGSQDASRAARDLHDALVKRTDLFDTVFAPAAESFFQDNAFLYLSSEDLEKVVDQLAEAQPALSALAADPNLKGLFGLLNTGIDAYEDGEKLPPLFVELMDRISDTGDDYLAGTPSDLIWDDAFSIDDDESTAIQLITVQGALDFSDLRASRTAIRAIRDIATDLELTEENGISVRLTGDVPLSDEEMQAVQDSVSVAGLVSLVLICFILGYGTQSLRIMVAIFATLIVGLIWTLAWAFLSVGELNMISATFAILFIGLGIDFSIHLCLRYQEAIEHGDDHRQAILTTKRSIGGAMTLCAISSAIGFISFVPTSYKGIAALGLISGGGMILALIASFTVLPAMLSILGRPSRTSTISTIFIRSTRAFFAYVGHYAKHITIGSVILLGLSATIAAQINFDYNTLALKDQDSESLQALKRLQDEGFSTDYTVTILADSLEAVDTVAGELKKLTTIEDVDTPYQFVPGDQDYKRALLDETSFMLWPVLNEQGGAQDLSDTERRDIILDLIGRLSTLRVRMADVGLRDSATRLLKVLQGILTLENQAKELQQFEYHLTSHIEEPLDFLRTALNADYIAFEDLPSAVTERVVAKDGRAQVVGLPAGDMTNFEAMKNMVEEVSAAFPNATGRPIVEEGVGNLVVNSFWIAMSLALSSIAVILFLTVREKSDILLIVTPLLMASSLSIATCVLFGIPLNQANIIAIPLILGLGVDNGIHVVMRFHEDDSMTNLMMSSTPRAVILSTLTTLGTFGALSLSIHQGIQSMGLLLAISMFYLLIFTVVVLPAMLTWRAQLMKQKASAA